MVGWVILLSFLSCFLKLVCYAHVFPCIFSALRPVLGGFITPAGCTKLELESSISYALAVTGFLLWVQGPYQWCPGRARTYGNTVVPVSHPGRGSMRVPSIALLDPFFSFLSFSFFSF